MAKHDERTAQIIPFPQGGRDRREPASSGSAQRPPALVRDGIDTGSAWYHEAAMREAAAHLRP